MPLKISLLRHRRLPISYMAKNKPEGADDNFACKLVGELLRTISISMHHLGTCAWAQSLFTQSWKCRCEAVFRAWGLSGPVLVWVWLTLLWHHTQKNFAYWKAFAADGTFCQSCEGICACVTEDVACLHCREERGVHGCTSAGVSADGAFEPTNGFPLWGDVVLSPERVGFIVIVLDVVPFYAPLLQVKTLLIHQC